MDSPPDISWLSELGMDGWMLMDDHHPSDLLMDLDDEAAAATELESCFPSNQINVSSTDSPSQGSPTPISKTRPQTKRHNNSFATHTTHPPVILNFGNPVETAAVFQSQGSQMKSKRQPVRVRPPSQTYDHIVAERKRRQQLSQRFITLSTIVPGLKKMDKTSILGDAIAYLKQLQEKVKILEEQASKKAKVSVVLVNKPQIMVDDKDSLDNKRSSEEQLLPEIEVRAYSNHIFVRVHCEKQKKGVLVNLLSKMENLNLSVVSANVTPFGDLSLDITVVAEMEKEFDLTAKEVVRTLRSAL